MTIRSNIAQTVAAAALFMGLTAGSVAHADSITEELIQKPIPAKLIVQKVDTSDCFDLENTHGVVGSYNSVCSALASMMPEQRKMQIIRARTRDVLFPKALDANGKRTGEREARAKLTMAEFRSFDDHQVAGLAWQLGVPLR